MRRMVRAQNSTTSPEFRLNRPFHSVPVKGDYKLSKKNEILVDLFLNTLFHTVHPPHPQQSPLPPSPSFLPTKFAWSFQFLFQIPASLPTGSPRVRGQVRGHLAGPALPNARNPATKGSAVGELSLGAKLSPSAPPPHPPTTTTLLPSRLSAKKTPAGMLQWAKGGGCCEHSLHWGSKVWMLSWGESHWALISHRKVGNKRRWRTSATARRQRRPLRSSANQAPRFSRRGVYYLKRKKKKKRNVPLEEPFYCPSNRFSVGQWKKMANWNNKLWNEMKEY